MNYKKILNILLCLFALLFIFGISLAFPEKIGLCQVDAAGCIEKFATMIGEPLLLWSIFLAIIILILRFLPKEVFHAWLFFGIWYIPLATIWIISTPAYGGAFLSPGKDWMTMTLGAIYMSVSILIILTRLIFLKLKKKKTR